MPPLRLGILPDPLSLWRAGHVSAILRAHNCGVDEVVPPTGSADTMLDALVRGGIDVAVYSLEDLPVDLPSGVTLAAVAGREDSRDALIGHEPLDWLELPAGATIAASGARRRGQLLAARPDLTIVDIDGALPDRIARFDDEPEWTALVATLANLLRLGEGDRIADELDPMLMVPAAGQGAIGVVVRSDAAALVELLRSTVHESAPATAVIAERAFVRALAGGPRAPVAAYAVRDQAGGPLRMHGRVVAADGSVVAEAISVSPIAEGDEAAAELFGAALAAEVLRRGARAILDV